MRRSCTKTAFGLIGLSKILPERLSGSRAEPDSIPNLKKGRKVPE